MNKACVCLISSQCTSPWAVDGSQQDFPFISYLFIHCYLGLIFIFSSSLLFSLLLYFRRQEASLCACIRTPPVSVLIQRYSEHFPSLKATACLWNQTLQGLFSPLRRESLVFCPEAVDLKQINTKVTNGASLIKISFRIWSKDSEHVAAVFSSDQNQIGHLHFCFIAGITAISDRKSVV